MSVLTVNFPVRLYRELKARAKRERRSVSQEVVVLLTQALELRPRATLLDLRGLGKELRRDVDAGSHVENERKPWVVR